MKGSKEEEVIKEMERNSRSTERFRPHAKVYLILSLKGSHWNRVVKSSYLCFKKITLIEERHDWSQDQLRVYCFNKISGNSVQNLNCSSGVSLHSYLRSTINRFRWVVEKESKKDSSFLLAQTLPNQSGLHTFGTD